jgi:hypothetical protein
MRKRSKWKMKEGAEEIHWAMGLTGLKKFIIF